MATTTDRATDSLEQDRGALLTSGILGILSPAVEQIDEKVESVR